MSNKPDVQPKATDHINEMIEMIESLVEKNVAYVVDQHVLFHVSKYKYYGKLSRRTKKNKLQEAELRLQVIKKTLRILFFGNPVRKMNRVGILHGEKVDLDGILSVVQCQKNV